MLGEGQDAFFLELQKSGLEREHRQLIFFIKVDLAHTLMLLHQGVIPAGTARALLSALEQFSRDGDEIAYDMADGSMLHQIEARLAAELGHDMAGMLHLGRSRIDQGATVRRLYKRALALKLIDAILELQAALIARADEHSATIMPGYTHMQHAQPWVFGHHLLSFVDKLQADVERLEQAYDRLNLNPLGTVGLVGTSWPLDRQLTTRLLGFAGIVANARLGRDATYAADMIGALSFTMQDLNDLSTDLHLWSSREFGFVSCDDRFCGTSSIFPQKKNPEALEYIKFAAGGAVNWLGTAFATFRGEGSGDQAMREMPMIDPAFATTDQCVRLLTALIRSLEVNADRMREALRDSWATASNLADLLVRRNGLSFRAAHHVVARLVHICLDRGITPSTVSQQELDEAAAAEGRAAPGLGSDAIREALDPDAFVATRTSEGGVAPAEVARLLAGTRQRMTAQASAQRERLDIIRRADAALQGAVRQAITSASA